MAHNSDTLESTYYGLQADFCFSAENYLEK